MNNDYKKYLIDRLIHLIRVIIYFAPLYNFIFKKYLEKRKNVDFNDELQNNLSSYLTGTLNIFSRNSVIASLLRFHCQKPISILDVGCAGGELAKLLNEKEIDIYKGIDISNYAIEYAKSHNICYNSSKIEFEQSDLCSYNNKNENLYDVIIFNEVLYYLDIYKLIKEVKRFNQYLKPDGFFCFSMKNDPKSKLIYKYLLKEYKLVDSFIIQQAPDGYNIRFNRENPAFLIYLMKGTNRTS